jgi:hypothetical protein
MQVVDENFIKFAFGICVGVFFYITVTLVGTWLATRKQR